MKRILALVVLMASTFGFAADVSIAGSRADVTTKFSGFVHGVGLAVEKSTATVMIMEGSCHPYTQDVEYLPGPDSHPGKGHGHDCMKNAMKIDLDLKADSDKMLYDFFSHAHGGVTVVTTNGKIAFVKTSLGRVVIEHAIPGNVYRK